MAPVKKVPKDPLKLLVKGLNEKTSKDGLLNFMEAISGGEVCDVVFGNDNSALVSFAKGSEPGTNYSSKPTKKHQNISNKPKKCINLHVGVTRRCLYIDFAITNVNLFAFLVTHRCLYTDFTITNVNLFAILVTRRCLYTDFAITNANLFAILVTRRCLYLISNLRSL